MKKRILIAALSLALLLSGCGGSMKSEAVMAPMAPTVSESAGSNGMGFDGMYWDEAEMDMPAEEPYAPEEGTPSGQKLIRRANLSLETTEFEQAAGDLEELVAKFGGYISDSSVGNRGSGHRWANFTIRIPEKHFDQFLNQVGDLCFETWRSTSQEDISQQYYDTAGRLKTQQIKLERLQELLSKADIMEDIITIESAISETEQMIDSLSGTMRYYDGMVNYATIEVELSEVYKFSDVEQTPVTFGQRMADAFAHGWTSFVDGMEEFVVALAYSWATLLMLAAIIVVVVLIARKRVRIRLPRKWKKKEKQDISEEK